MSKNKRGYTLIESIVVIAIVFILGGITIGLSFEGVAIEINSSFDDVYTSEITGDNIVVKFKEISGNEKTKIIHLSNGKLMLKTISSEDGKIKVGNNTIIDNINDFTVIKKGKLIYYCISSENSGVRIRCI